LIIVGRLSVVAEILGLPQAPITCRYPHNLNKIVSMAGNSVNGDSYQQIAVGLVTVFVVLCVIEFAAIADFTLPYQEYLSKTYPFVLMYGDSIRLIFLGATLMAFYLIEKGDAISKFFDKYPLYRYGGYVGVLFFGFVFYHMREFTVAQFSIIYLPVLFLFQISTFFATTNVKRRKSKLKNNARIEPCKKSFDSDDSFTLIGRDGHFLNIINPERSIQIEGNPGSGKSYFALKPILQQIVYKGRTGLIYDYKAPELIKYIHDCFWNFDIKSAVQHLDGTWDSEHRPRVTDRRRLWIINFSDLSRSHRVNPIAQQYMESPLDAREIANTVLVNLNPSWESKAGEFFSDSAIGYLAAILWLHRTEAPELCTLPHVISTALMPYEKVLAAMKTNQNCMLLIESMSTGDRKNAEGQISGQVATLQNSITKLWSPELAWVTSDSDFDFDLNDPERPGLLCVGNDPARETSYGPAISLMIRLTMNYLKKPARLKSVVAIDEFPTIWVPSFDSAGMATSRSYGVSYILVNQTSSQIVKRYGNEMAKNIIGTCGTHLFLQLSNNEDMKSASEEIGTMKIEKVTESTDKKEKRAGNSYSDTEEVIIKPHEFRSLEKGRVVGVLSETNGAFSPRVDVLVDAEKYKMNEKHEFNPFICLEKNGHKVYPTHKELAALAAKKLEYIQDQSVAFITMLAVEAVDQGKAVEIKVFPEHFEQSADGKAKRVMTLYGDPIDANQYILHKITGERIGTVASGYYDEPRNTVRSAPPSTKNRGAY
jgi:hypothetical protein